MAIDFRGATDQARARALFRTWVLALVGIVALAVADRFRLRAGLPLRVQRPAQVDFAEPLAVLAVLVVASAVVLNAELGS